MFREPRFSAAAISKLSSDGDGNSRSANRPQTTPAVRVTVHNPHQDGDVMSRPGERQIDASWFTPFSPVLAAQSSGAVLSPAGRGQQSAAAWQVDMHVCCPCTAPELTVVGAGNAVPVPSGTWSICCSLQCISGRQMDLGQALFLVLCRRSSGGRQRQPGKNPFLLMILSHFGFACRARRLGLSAVPFCHFVMPGSAYTRLLPRENLSDQPALDNNNGRRVTEVVEEPGS
ncbi:hypothetical protein QBC43DRAFT_17868 [Cladorrhinum sp. PSN259]|nr:hypothetical protein QBC43DRAFT_17868 [Cladorrhinum sp. PSN259]